MGFFKSLFGGQTESPEEQQKEKEAHDFDVLKFDGIKALRINQMPHAIRCFEAALDIKDDLEVHDYLSQAFIHTNQLDEAQQHLSILLRAEPDNIGILLRMANVSFMQEDYDAMAEMCQQTLALDDNLPAALMLLARAHIGQQRTDDAVAALTKIIDNDADMADAMVRAAITSLAPDVPALFLPVQRIGFSVEHLGCPGTLSFSPATCPSGFSISLIVACSAAATLRPSVTAPKPLTIASFPPSVPRGATLPPRFTRVSSSSTPYRPPASAAALSAAT